MSEENKIIEKSLNSEFNNGIINEVLLEELQNNSFRIDDIDKNQLTTNSEDLRQLSKEIREFAINNPSYLRIKNDIKRTSLSSKDESLSIFDQTEECQRMAINLEVNKEQEVQLKSGDDKYGWIIVLGSILCMIVVDGICFTMGLHNQSLKTYFSLSSLSLTILPSSVLSGIYLITSPLANPLANYFGYRAVACVGSLCTTISLLISSYCTLYVPFVIFFGIFTGIGFGLMYLPAIAIVAHWFNNLRAVAIGIALCGSGIGTCIFSFLLPYLIEWVQWKASIILLSACCCQSLVGIALFRPHELHQRLKKMRTRYKEWCLQNADVIKERKRLEKENRLVNSMRKEQKRREKLAKTKKIVIKRGSIFTRIMEEKSRQRTVSTGSLDGMMITQLNQLVNASQVDMKGMLRNQMNESSATMCSQNSVPNSLLQVRALDRVVEAALRALRSSSRNIIYMTKGKSPSESISKRSSTNSMSDMISNTDNILNDIPIKLVEDYVAKQRSLNKEDIQENGTNPSFKLGSTSLIGDEDYQAKLSNLNISETSLNSQQIKLQNETSEISSVRTSPRLPLELPYEVKHVIRKELLKEFDRPRSRKDIYFSGSMQTFLNSKKVEVKYRSNSLANFSKSNITSCRYSCPIMDSEKKVDLGEDSEISQKPVSNMQTSWITEIFDFNIMKSCAFQYLILSSITMMLGFFVPFFFLPIMLSDESVHWISGSLCALGSSNIAGRLAATLYIEKGWAMKYQKTNGVNLTILFLAVSGLTILLMPYVYLLHVGLVLVLAFIYGFCIAMIVSIRSMLVVELFGVENLTKTFTFLLIFQGAAAVVGPILAGAVCDIVALKRNVSEPAFLFSGVLFLLSASCAYALTQLSDTCCGEDIFMKSSKQYHASFTALADEDSYNHQTTQTTNLMVPIGRNGDVVLIVSDKGGSVLS